MPDVVGSQQVSHDIWLPWYRGGCSVLPIRTDGTKAPYFRWQKYQETRATYTEAQTWFNKGYEGAGVAIICGKISGNVELIELEGRASGSESLAKIEYECKLRGVDEVWNRLLIEGYAEWTPSGGIHLLYRIPEHEIPGNTKLAVRPARADELTDEELTILESNPNRTFWRTLAETRGEGGYVVVAPTGGHCHPSGEPWETVAGKQGELPKISWPARMGITAAITAALDETPAAPPPAPRKELVRVEGELSPGDDFNLRADWRDDWFTGEGWQEHSRDGNEIFWTRPGKNPRLGHSASTGYNGQADRLYVWSPSTGLPTEEPLQKFFVYAFYKHGGDMSAAARDLRRQGYGSPSKGVLGDAKLFLEAHARKVESTEKDPVRQAHQSEVALPVHGGVDLTDTGSGRRMKELHGDRFRWSGKEKLWYVFDGTSWKVDHYQEIQRAAEHAAEVAVAQAGRWIEEVKGTAEEKEARKIYASARSGLNHGKLTAAIARFAAQPGITIMPEQFDQVTDVLNLPNGTLDLKTKELRPHNPDELLSLTFGAELDPEATCPVFEQFMEDVLPDPEVRSYVQRALGYTLLGQPRERAMFMLHGPSGTGKSVLTKVMTTLFGDYGATAPASTFRLNKSDGQFDLHRLRGRRFVATSEMPEGAQLDEELVKRITGNDILTTRGLYESYQDWQAQCVIWIATNFLPKVNSDDNALWRRAKTIKMATEFGLTGPAEDIHMDEKLLAERSGILNWLLTGLDAYLERGLAQPEAISSDIETYRHDVDSVAIFIDDSAEEGILKLEPEALIKSSQLIGLYQIHCASNRMQPLGRRRLANRLRALGYEPEKVGGHSHWRGLRHDASRGTGGFH